MKSNPYLSRECPICQKNTSYKIEVSSKIKAEEMGYEILTPYWNGFFKEKIFFSYARCVNCDLLFAPIFYRADQLEKLYAQMPPNMDLVPMDALVRTQSEYFEELKRFGPFKNGYIEVGPDVGIFAEKCSREEGFDEFWLCEPNRSVLGTLENAIGNKKHIIIEDMFGFDRIPNQSADVAVMIQVLDHLLEPVVTLSELKKKLLPNAKLLLVTHNESSVLRRVVGWKWPAFCLQHPQIYNPKSITKLLKSAGYKVNSINRSKNYFEFSFLLKHLLWAFGIKIKSVPKILNFTIGLRLGNIITIATPEHNE